MVIREPEPQQVIDNEKEKEKKKRKKNYRPYDIFLPHRRHIIAFVLALHFAQIGVGLRMSVGTRTHNSVHHEIDGLLARAGASQVVQRRLDEAAPACAGAGGDGDGGVFAPLRARGVDRESLESRKARASLQ